MIDIVVVGGVFREILNGDTTPRPRLGGSGLTSSILASRLGARVSLVTYVGEEDAPALAAMLEAGSVDGQSTLSLRGASGTFVFPTEFQTGSPPWPMYRPAEAVPDMAPPIPEAKLYVVFGFPDFDPVASGWLARLSPEATLLWDRQGWISRARDCRAAGALPPQRKLYLAKDVPRFRRHMKVDVEESTTKSLLSCHLPS